MSKPTPGPWELIAERDLTLVIASREPRIDDRAFGIALIPHHEGADRIDWDTKQANARLIAAAPDLLAACDVALGTLATVGPREERARETLRAALALARGESEASS